MAEGKYKKWLEPDNLTLLAAWARDGLTDEQIAKNMRISAVTLYDWKKKYSKISKALKKNKELVDIEVENSLREKCLGQTVKEKRAFKCKRVYYDEEGRRCEEEHVETAEVETYIPADTMAIAIWLNNRQPNKWRRNANKEALDKERFEHQKKVDEDKTW